MQRDRLGAILFAVWIGFTVVMTVLNAHLFI